VADSVFVTDDAGRLLGVLTERDIFARLVGPNAELDQPVERLMVDHPNTLHLDQPVRRALELMQTGKFRNVPLVDDDGVLVGVVRPVDVLKYLAEAFPEELLNLPPRPHQRMVATEGA
jgi:CBS domain-containing protein